MGDEKIEPGRDDHATEYVAAELVVPNNGRRTAA